MNCFKSLMFALAVGILMTGCGSSGGGGVSKADITADNAKDLAIAGTEALKSSTKSDSAFPYKTGSGTEFDVKKFSKLMVQQTFAADNPLALDICTTGSATVTTNNTAGSGLIDFVNCVVTNDFSTVRINGSITMSGTSSSVTLSANLDVSEDVENAIVETVTFSAKCSVNNGAIGQCSFSSSFVGVDGRTYVSSNINVSGNRSSGFLVSGNVTDPDFGVVTISTPTGVLFGCSNNGNPSSGEIIVSGNDSSATVTFNDCNSFTVTLNANGSSVSTVYNWAEI